MPFFSQSRAGFVNGDAGEEGRGWGRGLGAGSVCGGGFGSVIRGPLGSGPRTGAFLAHFLSAAPFRALGRATEANHWGEGLPTSLDRWSEALDRSSYKPSRVEAKHTC